MHCARLRSLAADGWYGAARCDLRPSSTGGAIRSHVLAARPPREAPPISVRRAPARGPLPPPAHHHAHVRPIERKAPTMARAFPRRTNFARVWREPIEEGVDVWTLDRQSGRKASISIPWGRGGSACPGTKLYVARRP